MPRLVPHRPQTIEKILIFHGFILNHSRGSHRQYFHPTKRLHVTVPFHSRDLAMGTLRNIIKQSQLPISLFKR